MAELHFLKWRWAVYSTAKYEKLRHLLSDQCKTRWNPWEIKGFTVTSLIFVGVPNSASSSQANGGFGEPHNLPLARDDWRVWNRFRNLDSRRWRRTMWPCVVLNSRATKNSEVFQFKAPFGTKDLNFVPFFLVSLILGSHIRMRSRQCGLET